MNTLRYYENYRTLSERIAALHGRLQFVDLETEREDLLSALDSAEREREEIVENLRSYVPQALPCRSYFKALEERQFLFYRCISGMTMEKTALLMNVSRDTVYRIRRRIAGYDGTRSPLYDEWTF